MKTILKSLLILALSLADGIGYAQSIGPFLLTAPAVASGGGGTCTMLVSNEHTAYNGDAWGGIPSQQVSNTTTITICGAGFYSGSGDTGNYIEIRTAPNGGGSLLATSGTANMSPGWTVFTFATPYTVTAGSVVYATLIRNGGNSIYQNFGVNQEGIGDSYSGASPLADTTWNFILDTVQ